MADNGEKIKTLTPRIVIETKSFVELEKKLVKVQKIAG
jgi:hypothetical protein